MPENSLLSHDLFEGIFARAGLVTDIEFFEEFPSHYEVAVVRQDRWARGDWQLLPWIIGRSPDTSRAPIHASIPLIGRWKMLDNLRRTLFAPAAFVTLIAGWTLPFASPLIWTTFVLACIAIPSLLHVFFGAIPHRRGISKRSHARAVTTGSGACRIASRVDGDITCRSGMADDQRDRPDSITRLCDPPKFARMGDGSAGEIRVRLQPQEQLRPHEPHSNARGCGRRHRCTPARPEIWPIAAPFAFSLGPLSHGRLLD